MMRLMFTVAVAALVTACSAQTSSARSDGGVATAAPNGKGQTPAFPGQTRAPEVKSGVAYQVADYVTGISKPWGLAFLPGGALLISEKEGRLRVFENGVLSAPVSGVPAVDARDQGGLFGLAIDPNFATSPYVYMSFAEGHPDGKTNTAVARGKLVLTPGKPPALTEVKTIWRQAPAWDSTKHFGGRLVFGRDGTLFVTTGERSVVSGRMQAQNPAMALGKMIRINADGSIPKDNPFIATTGVLPEIYSIGHRNIQAAAINPATGDLWEVEHGAKGGDELNAVRPGRDYGWPTITYGIEYSGGKIGQGLTRKAGMEQPLYYWDPVIAPSGMAFYQADLFPGWKGSLFVGGLADKRLTRLVLEGDKVVGEERLLAEVGERLRDVVVGPDGALYIATDEDNGRVLKVTPKP